MPFGPVKTLVLYSPPRVAALEGLFGPLCLSSNLTPILMVQDILDNIGVVLEVLTLAGMMEGGVDSFPLGYIRL